MEITILGSGAWDGVPSLFCQCRVCTYASEHANSKENRSRPQLRVATDKGCFYIEISPDIRRQHQPEDGHLAGFLVSHWHYDHLYGVFELDAWADIVAPSTPKIYCPAGVSSHIDAHASFVRLQTIPVDSHKMFELIGVKITPIAVRHMFSLEANVPEQDLVNTYAYLLEHEGKRAVYMADFFDVPQSSLPLIHNVDALITDGTYLFEESFPDLDYQNKIRAEKDPDHLHGQAIIEWANDRDAKSVYYHSISHMPLLMHDQLQAKLPSNHYISYDGLTVQL